jgi:plasmid stability protein
VRTTVNIDDHLLAEAKVIAAQGHRSLGDVVNDALRLALSDRSGGSGTRGRVVLPVDGGSGLHPGVDLDDKDALAAILDDESAIRAPA